MTEAAEEILYVSPPLKTEGTASPALRARHLVPSKSRARMAILMAKLTYAEIARQLGVGHRSSVARVVYGHHKTAAIREGIARLVGKSVEQLWPER